MSTWKDISGNKAYMLTAIEYVGKDQSGKSMWRCRCDCGNETTISITKFGKTKSCGCIRHQTNHRFRDLTGQQFGNWYVLERAENRVTQAGYPRTMWICKCACGKVKEVDAGNLLSGASVSCGCKFDISSRNDLTGNRYDELLVVRQIDVDEPISGDTRWLCRCDCGGEIVVRGAALQRQGSHNCRKCNQIRGYRIEKGYRYVYKPDHPGNRDGWIREHRYVYETETGKSIPSGYKLHHIDMDKQHNTIDNLWLCTNKEHTDAHTSLNKIIKTLLERKYIGFSDGEYYRIK